MVHSMCLNLAVPKRKGKLTRAFSPNFLGAPKPKPKREEERVKQPVQSTLVVVAWRVAIAIKLLSYNSDAMHSYIRRSS